MGIKAGSGRGAADPGGSRDGTPGGVGSSRKRDKRPPALVKSKKPLRPIEDTFPRKQALRLGQYRVIEEKDDYLLCTGFDPNAENPFAEVTPTAFRTGVLMKVAKPWALQRTIWEQGPVTIGGVEYTFEYSDDEFGVRTARWTDEDGEEQEEEQRIDIAYTVSAQFEPPKQGDLIVAVEIKKNAAVEGMTVTDEEGTRLRWMDLNVSGRHWKSQVSRDAETIRFMIESAQSSDEDSGTEGVATVTVLNVSCGDRDGDETVTVYDPLLCILNEDPADLVGRKGFAVRMKNPDHDPDNPDSPECRYEIIALCCP